MIIAAVVAIMVLLVFGKVFVSLENKNVEHIHLMETEHQLKLK